MIETFFGRALLRSPPSRGVAGRVRCSGLALAPGAPPRRAAEDFSPARSLAGSLARSLAGWATGEEDARWKSSFNAGRRERQPESAAPRRLAKTKPREDEDSRRPRRRRRRRRAPRASSPRSPRLRAGLPRSSGLSIGDPEDLGLQDLETAGAIRHSGESSLSVSHEGSIIWRALRGRGRARRQAGRQSLRAWS